MSSKPFPQPSAKDWPHTYLKRLSANQLVFDGRTYEIHPIIDELRTVDLPMLAELTERTTSNIRANVYNISEIFGAYTGRTNPHKHVKLSTEQQARHKESANAAIKLAATLEEECSVIENGMTLIHEVADKKDLSGEEYVAYLKTKVMLGGVRTALRYRAKTLKYQEEILRNPELLWNQLAQ